MVKPQNHRLISHGMLLPVSRFMLRWNLALIVMLAYTALLTPYEVRAGTPARGGLAEPDALCRRLRFSTAAAATSFGTLTASWTFSFC